MRWLAARLPDRETLLAQRFLRPLAHRLGHPALWHFNRWSVSRGIALGLFCGFLVPMGQIFLAALIALTWRANLIVAAGATLVTNPFTFPPIYYAAYRVGDRVVGQARWSPLDPDAAETYLARGWAWLLDVSLPTVVGLVTFALVSALLSYWTVQLGWRIWTARRWARRRAA